MAGYRHSPPPTPRGGTLDAAAPLQSDVTVGRGGLLPRYARIVGCHIRQFNPFPTAAERLVQGYAGETTVQGAADLSVLRCIEFPLGVQHRQEADLPVSVALLRLINRSAISGDLSVDRLIARLFSGLVRECILNLSERLEHRLPIGQQGSVLAGAGRVDLGGQPAARVEALNVSPMELVVGPKVSGMEKRGYKPATATPTLAFDCAYSRSALRISGRRAMTSEGSESGKGGTTGIARSPSRSALSNSSGLRPSRSASE